MGATVAAVYVSSRPGASAVTPASVLLALLVGGGVAVVSAYSPAREASFVPPIEAMAHGRREYATRVHKTRDVWIALAVGVAGSAAARCPPIGRTTLFCFFAAFFFFFGFSVANPAVVC